MATPRVFVSHSAGTEAPAIKVLDALRAGLGQEFDVFIDREDLRVGMSWRRELHLRLARCDAAVLVLSQRALESAWVLEEATILNWRRALAEFNRTASFPLLPIILPPVSRQDLQNNAQFRALALGEIQMLKDDSPEVVASKIKTQLLPLQNRLRDEGPLHGLEIDVASWLRTVGPQHLELAAAQLGTELVAVDEQDMRAQLARALVEAPPDPLLDALEVVAKVIQVDLDRAHLLSGLSPLWVDLEAAGPVADSVVDLGALRWLFVQCAFPEFTAGMYVKRCHFPYWAIVDDVTPAAGEDVVGHFVREIRVRLKVMLLNPLVSNEQLDATLRARLSRMRPRPTFAVVPALLTEDQLTQMEERIPGCIFVMASPRTGASISAQRVRVLKPPDQTDEQTALGWHSEAARLLRQTS